MTAAVEPTHAAPGGDSRWFAYLRDRLAASDPAFSRLRLASRAMISVLLTGAILALITFFVHPLPVAAYGLAPMLCFTGSMAVRDRTVKGRFYTRLIAVPVVVAVVFLASVLAPVPRLADIAFLVVIFAAVYVRRFGPRWFAVGMMAFMAFFMGDYLKPGPWDIGWILLAATIALSMAHIVGTVILPADDERDFRRALVTVDRRINLILRQLRHAAREGTASQDDTKQIRRHMARLRDTILMAEGFLPQGPEGSLAAKGAASDVAVALFHLQLVVERLVRTRHFSLPPVDLVQAALDHDDDAISAFAETLADDGAEEDTAARLLVRLQRARMRLAEALGPTPSPAFGETGSPPRPSPPGPNAGEEGTGLVPEVLKTPIQITLACAVAMGLGLLISPDRWYWAVITAFIVFNNTRSRGDTAVRALQRSAGTFAGFLVGTAVATLLQGHVAASTVLIFAFFFLAFYFVQTSYSIMIFFITIALALIYGLMGMFTPEILILRLEETVIGAVAGTLMAFMVFPKRTTSGVSEGLDDYLAALEALVEGAAAKAREQGDAPGLLSLSRALDRKYADLAQLVRPLGGPWNAVTRFGAVRERLLLLSGAAHWARVLAQNLSGGTPPGPDELANIEEISTRLSRQIAVARENRALFFHKTRRDDEDDRGAPRRPVSRSGKDRPIVALEAVSAMLDHAGWRAPEEDAVGKV